VDEMTFPRFQLRTDEDVPPEVLNRRLAFALGPLAKRMAAPNGNVEPNTADVISPEDFGRKMVEIHGKAWPQMIALATGAAMQAERDAMGEVE
jgi:hypothetical protein